MQLDEFVKTTILQVIKGVKDAQVEAIEFGAIVNPRANGGLGEQTATDVSFDVALSVTGTSAEEMGGRVAIASIINFGGKATGSDSRQETSRIQFSVAVALPTEARHQREPEQPVHVPQLARP